MMEALKKLSLFLIMVGLPLAVQALETPKILRLSECQYEDGSSRLKSLKVSNPFRAGDSIDLNFQSKQEAVYPIVDWKLIKQNGQQSASGQIDVSLIEGGLNFITWNAPVRESDDSFLVLRVNEKDCYYAQLKSVQTTSLESPGPTFVKADLSIFPMVTSCSLQETAAPFTHMLVSLILLSMVLILMHRLRIHSRKLHL